MGVYDRKIRALPDVMRCLELCYRDECENCNYCGHGCSEMLGMDALFWLKELRSDNERLRDRLKILRSELAEERERSARWLRESEPVVHGHNTYDHDSAFECSVCGFSDWDTLTADSGKYNYCPHCGAHMDEEVAE